MSAFRLNIRRGQAELRPSSPVSTSSDIQPSGSVAARPSTSAETDVRGSAQPIELSGSLFDPEDEFNVMPATPPRSVVARQSLPVRESLARTKYSVKKGTSRRLVPYQQITLQPPVVQPNENDSLMAAGLATQQLSLTEAYATAKPSCDQSSMSVAEQPWRQNTLPPVQHRVIPARSVLGLPAAPSQQSFPAKRRRGRYRKRSRDMPRDGGRIDSNGHYPVDVHMQIASLQRATDRLMNFVSHNRT